MQTDFDVAIVGGGHAGAYMAIALRQAQFKGSIAIIGDEPDLPYERPPLSKEYLAGEKSFDRILIRPPRFWTEREIAMLLGRGVTAVDAQAHRLTLADGQAVGYGKLVWATGGSGRQLACSGHRLRGVHGIRSRADADCLITELGSVGRAVVIGGGYIGLEAAAALVKLGKHVTVLEALDRVLSRVAGEPLSRFYESEHRARGVDLRLNAAIDCIVDNGSGAVGGVRLADGELISCDMVIVGIGIVPAVAPLITAGAAGNNGVAVDSGCRTSLVDVFAIGDCALHFNAFARGAAVRLESVQNATDQAAVVAKILSGGEAKYQAVPSFWSNQYDLRLQTIGLFSGYDALVLRGNPAARSFSVVYLREGRVIALDCVNAVKDYVQGRALIVAGARIAPATLGDAGISLKAMDALRPIS